MSSKDDSRFTVSDEPSSEFMEWFDTGTDWGSVRIYPNRKTQWSPHPDCDEDERGVNAHMLGWVFDGDIQQLIETYCYDEYSVPENHQWGCGPLTEIEKQKDPRSDILWFGPDELHDEENIYGVYQSRLDAGLRALTNGEEYDQEQYCVHVCGKEGIFISGPEGLVLVCPTFKDTEETSTLAQNQGI